jgi:putative redox protein
MIRTHLSLVKSTNTEKYLTESKVRQFTIKADEPIINKGTDLAPTPLDLLCISLSSCTAMYLRNISEKYNITTGKIDVKVKVLRDENKEILFIRDISFEHSISEEEKSFLTERSNLTPITKLILGNNAIQTKLK